jgi:two-component system CheB/CheR fusion protein
LRKRNQPEGAAAALVAVEAVEQIVSRAQRAQEEAERANRAKDEFLAILSHELRTPLSALLMQVQLLRQGGCDAAKLERACVAIERSTKMQVKLVDDLLDVSRIITGKLRVDLQPVDLVSAVRISLADVIPLAVKKGIELGASLDESLGLVAGDRTRLEQVVLNLIGNAIKFTPEGGRVEVLLESAHGLAHLQVSDTGAGIAPDFLPHIFERLTQDDQSSTRPFGGLGLGLAIVRHLLDAHGGTVRAESPGPGLGATFHVTLPLLTGLRASAMDSANPTPEDCPVSPQSRTPAGRLAGRRVLVLEDDASIRDALSEMLTRMGAAVRTAESAAIAIGALQQFRPDVLLCDIAMPVEDGYSFIRTVRGLGAQKGGDTPALALTALAGERDRSRALSEGFQMHLVKPVEMGPLVDAVAQLLRT